VIQPVRGSVAPLSTRSGICVPKVVPRDARAEQGAPVVVVKCTSACVCVGSMELIVVAAKQILDKNGMRSFFDIFMVKHYLKMETVASANLEDPRRGRG